MELRGILCPIDFSADSLAASQLSAALAGAWGSSVALMHVERLPGGGASDRPPVDVLAPVWQDYVQARHAALQTLFNVWRRAIGVEIPTRVVIATDETSTAIINHTRESRPALVVMGSHGPGEEGVLLGSVAAGVAATASCPVLVTRADHADRYPAGGRFERVLRLVDQETITERPIPLLSHLLAPHAVVDVGLATSPPVSERARILEEALAGAAAQLPAGVSHRPLDTAPRPLSTVLDHLRSGASDLVCLHARAGDPDARKRVLGALADRLMHQSPVPVLITPPPEPEED